MAEDTRRKILQAAYEEFAQKGRSGARMQSIADRAGINKAMLNYYFTSKHQLYLTVIRDKLERYDKEISEILTQEEDAQAFIREFTRVHHLMLKENPEWIKLLLRNYLEDDSEALEEILKSDLHIMLQEKLQRFIERGELRGNNPHQLMINIASLNILSHIFMPMVSKYCKAQNIDEYLSDRLNSILDLFNNGMFLKQK